MQLDGVNVELRQQALRILDESLMVNCHDFNPDGVGNEEAKLLGQAQERILAASVVGEDSIRLVQFAATLLENIANKSSHPDVVERSSRAARLLFDLANLTERGS